MNISFNGLKHISGSSRVILQNLIDDSTINEITPMVVSIKGDQADAFILTEKDGDNFIKEHIDLGAEVPEGSANDALKAGLEMGNKIKALLSNSELIIKYFNEQKAKGAEVEEIKL